MWADMTAAGAFIIWLTTAADPTAPDWLAPITSAGVAGAVVLAIIFGYLHPKSSVTRLEESLRRAEDRRDQLIDVYQREVIPALHEFNRVAAALLPMLQKMVERELGR